MPEHRISQFNTESLKLRQPASTLQLVIAGTVAVMTILAYSFSFSNSITETRVNGQNEIINRQKDVQNESANRIRDYQELKSDIGDLKLSVARLETKIDELNNKKQ